jgi:hypothetical protein
MPPLSDLLVHCDSAAVSIVERAAAKARGLLHQDVENALIVVMDCLLPYPALRIAPTFWESEAGMQVREVQWMLYSEEALMPAQAALAIFGKSNATALNLLTALVERRELSSYLRPDRSHRNIYYLQSEVNSYLASR